MRPTMTLAVAARPGPSGRWTVTKVHPVRRMVARGIVCTLQYLASTAAARREFWFWGVREEGDGQHDGSGNVQLHYTHSLTSVQTSFEAVEGLKHLGPRSHAPARIQEGFSGVPTMERSGPVVSAAPQPINGRPPRAPPPCWRRWEANQLGGKGSLALLLRAAS